MTKPRIRYTSAPTEAQERQLEAAYPLLIDRDTSTPARARRACRDVWEVMVRNCDYPCPELTRRQMEVLKQICEITDANGGWFTAAQVQEKCKFAHWQVAHAMIGRIMARGFIKQTKRRGRYRVVKRPPFALHEID